MIMVNDMEEKNYKIIYLISTIIFLITAILLLLIYIESKHLAFLALTLLLIVFVVLSLSSTIKEFKMK